MLTPHLQLFSNLDDQRMQCIIQDLMHDDEDMDSFVQMVQSFDTPGYPNDMQPGEIQALPVYGVPPPSQNFDVHHL